MKLKKAVKSTIYYPSKESLKPIFIGVGVAMALSACTNPTHKQPKEPVKSTKEGIKHEGVKYPENVAGGMPVFTPHTNFENNATWVNKSKKQ